ncbi:C4-dicarboxylate transporter DctA, partial [Verminephrobacter eiseniae]|nr:C4-dicarboxylate transporter DctA [Verminephrobacter eiseniae]
AVAAWEGDIDRARAHAVLDAGHWPDDAPGAPGAPDAPGDARATPAPAALPRTKR